MATPSDLLTLGYCSNLTHPSPDPLTLTHNQFLISPTPDISITNSGLTAEYKVGRPLCPRA